MLQAESEEAMMLAEEKAARLELVKSGARQVRGPRTEESTPDPLLRGARGSPGRELFLERSMSRLYFVCVGV